MWWALYSHLFPPSFWNGAPSQMPPTPVQTPPNLVQASLQTPAPLFMPYTHPQMAQNAPMPNSFQKPFAPLYILNPSGLTANPRPQIPFFHPQSFHSLPPNPTGLYKQPMHPQYQSVFPSQSHQVFPMIQRTSPFSQFGFQNSNQVPWGFQGVAPPHFQNYQSQAAPTHPKHESEVNK